MLFFLACSQYFKYLFENTHFFISKIVFQTQKLLCCSCLAFLVGGINSFISHLSWFDNNKRYNIWKNRNGSWSVQQYDSGTSLLYHRILFCIVIVWYCMATFTISLYLVMSSLALETIRPIDGNSSYNWNKAQWQKLRACIMGYSLGIRRMLFILDCAQSCWFLKCRVQPSSWLWHQITQPHSKDHRIDIDIHRSDTFASDRCLIYVDPKAFAIWAAPSRPPSGAVMAIVDIKEFR